MPRINTNIKILTAVLLAGFILLNLLPFVSFAQYEPGLFDQPSTEQEKQQEEIRKQNVEKAGEALAGMQCPEDSFIHYDKNERPDACIIKGAFKKSGDTIICDDPKLKVYYEGNQPIGCITTPTKIVKEKDLLKPTEVSQIEIQKYTTYSEIPCQPGFGGLGGTCPKAEEGPAQYLVRLYQFGLMIAGLAAFGSIVYGSLKYILSAGNIGSTEEAKDIIRQAIYGLVLLLGAYLILYTINPNLVNLRNPDVSPLDIASVIKKGALPEEQRLPSSSNEEHPLCQSGVSSGLTVQSNIKIEGQLKEALGAPSEISDFTCLKCKANAVKSSESDCECKTGFVLNNAGNGCIRPVGVTAPELLPKQQSPIFEYQPPNYVELPKQQ